MSGKFDLHNYQEAYITLAQATDYVCSLVILPLIQLIVLHFVRNTYYVLLTQAVL